MTCTNAAPKVQQRPDTTATGHAPVGLDYLWAKNATLTGGLAPVRNYIEGVLPDVLSGAIDPGKVFDAEVALEDVAHAYDLMITRERLKVMVRP